MSLAFKNTVKAAAWVAFSAAVFCLAVLALPGAKPALAADPAPTGFAMQAYFDNNSDGVIDQLMVVINEPLTTCNFDAADWTYVGNSIGGSISGGSCDVGTQTVTINITGANANVTGSATEPTIAFNDSGAGNIANVTGSLGVVSATSLTDDASPIILSAKYMDIAPAQDGTVDTVRFAISADTGVDCGAFSEGVNFAVTHTGTVALASGAGDTCTTNGTNRFDVTLGTPGAAHVTGGSDAPVVTYLAFGGAVADAGGNAIQTATGVTVADGAAPVITGAAYQDIAPIDGTVDTIVYFTSADTGVNCSSFSDSDFGVENAGTVNIVAGAGNTCLSTNGTTFFAIKLGTSGAAGVTGGTSVPSVDYLNADPGVVDGAGNRVLLTTNISVADAAPPVILSAKYMDLNANGTIETIRVHLSADVGTVLTAYNASDWSLPATGIFSDMAVSGAAMNGANDVDVTVTTGFTDRTGSATPVTITYTNNANRLHDGSTNATQTATGVTAADGAPPLFVMADYRDDNHDGTIEKIEVEMTFDTTLSATFNSSDWSLPVGGTILNLHTPSAIFVSSNIIDLTVAAAAHVTGGGTSPTLLFTNTGNANRVHDLAGNAAATLGAALTVSDGAAPVLLSTTPANTATGIDPTAMIVADFSESMANGFSPCTFTTSPDPGGFLTASPVSIDPTPDAGALWSAGVTTLSKSRVTLAHSAYALNAVVSAAFASCFASGNAALAVNPAVPASFSFTIHGASSGAVGGGGGGSVPTPTVTVRTPVNGASYTAGTTVGLEWASANGAFVKYRASYSADNGITWSVAGDNITATTFVWTVPSAATGLGVIKIDGLDSGNNIIATGLSNGNFTVIGAIAPVTPGSPATDSTATGVYSAALARANTTNINIDKTLVAPPVGTTVYCLSGTLIKGSLSAVYYCGADGKRYVFVNDKAFFTWYTDFSSVQTISDTDLAKISLGGNITYRPGARLVKVTTDSKVYAVSRGGILRWVSSEAVALQLYGANWAQLVDDIPDAFFVNYKVGAPL